MNGLMGASAIFFDCSEFKNLGGRDCMGDLSTWMDLYQVSVYLRTEVNQLEAI